MHKENIMKLSKIANFLRAQKQEKTEEKKFLNYSYGGRAITELFSSLRDELKGTIIAKYGKGVWLDDFSDTEAIFSKDAERGMPEYDDEGQRKYYKVSYTLKDGEATLTSEPTVVKRVTSYTESIISLQAFMNMAVYQMELKKGKHE